MLRPWLPRKFMGMRMSVIGTGYLGSTHAACMAELGHEVIGVDVDPHKIELLSRGETPFFEPGLDGLIRKHISSGRLHFTTSYQEAAELSAAADVLSAFCEATRRSVSCWSARAVPTGTVDFPKIMCRPCNNGTKFVTAERTKVISAAYEFFCCGVPTPKK